MGPRQFAMQSSQASQVQITPQFLSQARSHHHEHHNFPWAASPRQFSPALRSAPLGYPKGFRFVAVSTRLEHLC